MAVCQGWSISRAPAAPVTSKFFLQNGEKEVDATISNSRFLFEENLHRVDAEELSMLPNVLQATLCDDIHEFSLSRKLPNNGYDTIGKRVEKKMCIKAFSIGSRPNEENMMCGGSIMHAASLIERSPNGERSNIRTHLGNSLGNEATLKEVLPQAEEKVLMYVSRDGDAVKSTTVGNTDGTGVCCEGDGIAWDELNVEKALLPLENSLNTQPSVQRITFLLLKCKKEKSYGHVLQLYAYVRHHGLETHELLGNHLVLLLAEAEMMCDAQQVFDGLSHRKKQSWNLLITSYVRMKKPQHALDLYQRMQQESFVSPDPFTFISLMKACTELKDRESAGKLHDHILRIRVLERHTAVGNALVNMYVNFRMLGKAHEVFEQLPLKNVISWNTLIAGYAKYGRGQEALGCLEQMELEGIFPNHVTYICSLKACGSIGDVNKGVDLHADIARKGLLETDLQVGSALVDMYAKSGLLMKAQEVLDKLPTRNIVSWNALIAGYVNADRSLEALRCFERVQREGIPPDAVTFISCLKACSNAGAIDEGRKIHDQIMRGSDSLHKDPVVGSALVSMYAKCGLLVKAQEVFDKLPTRNVISWTALIDGYGEHGHGEEALHFLKQMQIEGICPNAATFACSLKACSSVGAIQGLHAEIARKQLLKGDTLVCSTLVDMYAKCGSLLKAQEVFDKIATRNTILWNALLTGYLDHGCGEDALVCFDRMQLEGALPDAVTYLCGLMACSGTGDIHKGRQLHCQIVRDCIAGGYVAAGNVLVDMYMKCGLLNEAQDVFDELPSRDIVTWNALLAGYAQSEFGEEAISCFEDMTLEGVSPDVITYDCMLKACGSIGAAMKGQEIHAELAKDKEWELDSGICNALVGMYANCGLLSRAQDVFDNLVDREVALWTALISGYAQLGEVGTAFDVFSQMLNEGVKPNMVTFVGMLNSCTHAGLIEKGQRCFEAMCTIYDIAPVSEHYTCMIDLLCRAGQLEYAIFTTKETCLLPDVVVLRTLLGACKDQTNVELGRQVFEEAVQCDQYSAAAYISMYKMYADG
ncbi:hypothetical protein GOP47_0029640 [Adiantum capillus-veneris]|nr:hypothetical protein GOP47_0029640 [Adiantum capillus-veneris]